MPDLTFEEADRCPQCDAIVYGRGPCVKCGRNPEEPHKDDYLFTTVTNSSNIAGFHYDEEMKRLGIIFKTNPGVVYRYDSITTKMYDELKRRHEMTESVGSYVASTIKKICPKPLKMDLGDYVLSIGKNVP